MFLTLDMVPKWEFLNCAQRLFKVLKAIGEDEKREL